MKTIFEPEEIALKKFVIRWRGYDTREVESFLRAVAVDFRRLIEHAAAADQGDAPEPELSHVRDELNRLSSQLDRALAGLDAPESTEFGESTESGESIEDDASTEDGESTEGLRLVAGGSGRG